MKGQGRLGDLSQVTEPDKHGCPACPHPAIGPAISASPDVMVNDRPGLRDGDPGIHAFCCGTNTWTAEGGSGTVFYNRKPAHRKEDNQIHCGSSKAKLTTYSTDTHVGD
jgi:uncharacterized Zn-binding protein involved in type VI secretion